MNFCSRLRVLPLGPYTATCSSLHGSTNPSRLILQRIIEQYAFRARGSSGLVVGCCWWHSWRHETVAKRHYITQYAWHHPLRHTVYNAYTSDATLFGYSDDLSLSSALQNRDCLQVIYYFVCDYVHRWPWYIDVLLQKPTVACASFQPHAISTYYLDSQSVYWNLFHTRQTTCLYLVSTAWLQGCG
jgi:hypothetical protein